MPATQQPKKPAKAPKPLAKRKCQWCGTVFETAHPAKMFCVDAHKNDFGNWMASRGKVLMPIALAWRTARGRKGTGAKAMAEMVRFLDAAAAELTAQGAPPIAKHFEASRAASGVSHWNDFDRKRPSRSRPQEA